MINKIYVSVRDFIKENFKFLLIWAIILFLLQFELPYKIYKPGGEVLLNDRVKFSEPYEQSGKLGMAYVSVVRGNIPFLLLSYLLPDWDIYSDSDLTLENESWSETLKKDQILFSQSIDSAIISAYTLANKDINIKKEVAHITYIDDMANTTVKLFDILLKVDNESVNDLEQLRSIVSKHKSGDELSLLVLRDDKEVLEKATVYDTDDGPKIGLAITTTYEYDENPSVNIEARQSESGPSGGLMMSLAIYNGLVSEDITKGLNIIGTGTIDVLGNVGAIGGVKYKLLGAVKKKCDVFLVPIDNLEEANQIKNEKNLDIKIIGVKTLSDALNELSKL